MKTTRIWAALFITAALSVAPAVAQRGPAGPPRGGFGGRGPIMGGDPARMLTRLATVLDLTDAQKGAAQTIFSTAKTQAEPVQTALREAQQAVHAAVKANKSDSEIETLTARSGALMGQTAAIHAKAQRAFLQLLTAQQREKLETLNSQMHDRPQTRP
jgi:Spy/CpxP family protein refolding chaperone